MRRTDRNVQSAVMLAQHRVNGEHMVCGALTARRAENASTGPRQVGGPVLDWYAPWDLNPEPAD